MAVSDSSNVNYFDPSSSIGVEEVKENALYVHEVRQEDGYGPAYIEAREEFEESAVNYLEGIGMSEETARLHASRVETEAAIGDVYEAVEKVDAWSKLLEGEEDINLEDNSPGYEEKEKRSRRSGVKLIL